MGRDNRQHKQIMVMFAATLIVALAAIIVQFDNQAHLASYVQRSDTIFTV